MLLNLYLKSATALCFQVFEIVSLLHRKDHEGSIGCLVFPQNTEEYSGGLFWHEVRTQTTWTQRLGHLGERPNLESGM